MLLTKRRDGVKTKTIEMAGYKTTTTGELHEKPKPPPPTPSPYVQKDDKRESSKNSIPTELNHTNFIFSVVA